MNKTYSHPKIEGFLKNYQISDLVPAVEVIGCAGWYEDELLTLRQERDKYKDALESLYFYRCTACEDNCKIVNEVFKEKELI